MKNNANLAQAIKEEGDYYAWFVFRKDFEGVHII